MNRHARTIRAVSCRLDPENVYRVSALNAADEIERLERERDEARAERSRLWRCIERAWMSCHACAQEFQCDDMTPTADGWICDDCTALAAEGE